MPLDELVEKITAYYPAGDTTVIRRAYAFAVEAFRSIKYKYKEYGTKYRKTGDPYIEHVLKTAEILAELHLDVPTIAAALLHDVIEDTSVRPQLIRDTFGEEIYQLVDGVTKLSKVVSYAKKEDEQLINLRKMFLAMAKDVRVVLIKLADRLHNMRTLDYQPEEKKKKIAQETLEIFAPLAHRLGISQIKWELEDLAFKILMPVEYENLSHHINRKKDERERSIQKIISSLKDEFRKNGIRCEITGRPKHFYSIYQKMKKSGKDFDEIYDLSGVRIIVPTLNECYQALGIVHSLGHPIPGSFDDYISNPKSNMYQSLHTVIVWPNGELVEVQIRTPEMHKIAEYGIAAHWKYKEEIKDGRYLEQKILWLRQLWEGFKESRDVQELMDSLKSDLIEEEIFVFTPKGDIIKLPLGATPVDFAYQIHTEVGHRCVGAKVNGKITSLDYQLKNGEIVEIITSREERPKRDWLSFVRTSAARSKINHWFKEQSKEENIFAGKELLEQEVRKQGYEPIVLLREEWLKNIGQMMRFKSNDDLMAAIGCGDISPRLVLNRLKNIAEKEKVEISLPSPPQPRVKKRQVRAGQGIIVEGKNDILVRISKCCSPIPGDKIIGYISQRRGVTVHREDCPNAKDFSNQNQRLLKVEWDDQKEIYYPVEVNIESLDRVGILNDVTSAIREFDTNVKKVSARAYNGRAKINLVLEVSHKKNLEQIIEKIKRLKDVLKVERIIAR